MAAVYPFHSQVRFVMGEGTTLGDLLELQLHRVEDEVKNIVDKAVKEMAIEKVSIKDSIQLYNSVLYVNVVAAMVIQIRSLGKEVYTKKKEFPHKKNNLNLERNDVQNPFIINRHFYHILKKRNTVK